MTLTSIIKSKYKFFSLIALFVFALDFNINSCAKITIVKDEEDIIKEANKLELEELTESIKQGNLTKVQDIISSGFYIDQEINIDGYTPLMLATSTGQEKIVEYLIDEWAQVNKVNSNGETALFLAIYTGNENIVRMLLNVDAHINILNKSGDTALMVAASRGDDRIVQYLLEKDADTKIINKAGKKAIDMVPANKLDLINKLIKNRAKEKRIVEILNFKDNMVQTFFAFQLKDINKKNINGETILMSASTLPKNSLELAQLLIDLGANLESVDSRGYTALAIAIANNRLDVIKLLLDSGAEINESVMTEMSYHAFDARERSDSDRIKLNSLLLKKFIKQNGYLEFLPLEIEKLIYSYTSND